MSKNFSNMRFLLGESPASNNETSDDSNPNFEQTNQNDQEAGASAGAKTVAATTGVACWLRDGNAGMENKMTTIILREQVPNYSRTYPKPVLQLLLPQTQVPNY